MKLNRDFDLDETAPPYDRPAAVPEGCAVRQSDGQHETTRLASSVAVHDLNNLFQVVMSALHLIERRPELRGAGDLTFIVRSARQAADKAASLTRRLLMTSHDPPPTRKLVRVNSVLLALEDLLRTILGPQIELENTVINLAINARDAMPLGGRLRIETFGAELPSAQSGLPRGRYLAVSVSDTGSGMTQEAARHAFDPFFTTKPAGAGSGLGLPSVKGFVDRHNGHVSIETHVGLGTAVRLYLPC